MYTHTHIYILGVNTLMFDDKYMTCIRELYHNCFRQWLIHDDVIKWRHFLHYWPFVREIHLSPVNSPHKGQWRGALMLSLICVWINGWVNNREAGDLRPCRTHYDVIVTGPSHYATNADTELNSTKRNTFQWNLKQNAKTFLHENGCKIPSIWFQVLHSLFLFNKKVSIDLGISLNVSLGDNLLSG